MRHQTGQPDRSQRQLRVGEELKHAIVETLQRGHFHDEVLIDAAPGVTVTEVRISPDLKNATAYIMTLGGVDMDDVMKALNNATHFFQKEIGRKLRLKFTPRLRFTGDDTFDNADRITHLLNQIELPREEGEEPDSDSDDSALNDRNV